MGSAGAGAGCRLTLRVSQKDESVLRVNQKERTLAVPLGVMPMGMRRMASWFGCVKYPVITSCTSPVRARLRTGGFQHTTTAHAPSHCN